MQEVLPRPCVVISNTSIRESLLYLHQVSVIVILRQFIGVHAYLVSNHHIRALLVNRYGGFAARNRNIGV